ncbi:MAG: hypothetical protein V4534_04105 [Myxococcota bacterium]
MERFKILIVMIFGLIAACGSSKLATSNNPVMQGIINDFAQIDNSCPANPAESAAVKAPTQEEVNAVVAVCSASELAAIQADMDCQVKACTSPAPCPGAGVSGSCDTAIKNGFRNQ